MISVEQLVDRQVRKWARQNRNMPAQRPLITVSRAFGARGGELAERVAAQLDYDLWDRRIVDEIAASAKLRGHIVASLDDRVQDRAIVWLSDRFERGYFSESDYLRHLTAIIDAIGRQGRAVIVGRGAHLIVDPARTMRVRVTAPLEPRVAWLVKSRAMTADEARARALRVDAERRAFAQQHFGVELDHPSHFDLVLSTDVMSLERGIELVLQSFRQRFGDSPSVAA